MIPEHNRTNFQQAFEDVFKPESNVVQIAVVSRLLTRLSSPGYFKDHLEPKGSLSAILNICPYNIEHALVDVFIFNALDEKNAIDAKLLFLIAADSHALLRTFLSLDIFPRLRKHCRVLYLG